MLCGGTSELLPGQDRPTECIRVRKSNQRTQVYVVNILILRNRPHDIVAVPDLDFAQEEQSEAQPPKRTSVGRATPEIRPEQQYYNYQTQFLSNPQYQQYPGLGLQTGSISSDNQYSSHYGVNNYYVKPAVSYYGNTVEGTRNNVGNVYCRNYYGYLQPCHNWSNTIGGWWTDS